jgi:hypothetical protein
VSLSRQTRSTETTNSTANRKASRALRLETGVAVLLTSEALTVIREGSSNNLKGRNTQPPPYGCVAQKPSHRAVSTNYEICAFFSRRSGCGDTAPCLLLRSSIASDFGNTPVTRLSSPSDLQPYTFNRGRYMPRRLHPGIPVLAGDEVKVPPRGVCVRNVLVLCWFCIRLWRFGRYE